MPYGSNEPPRPPLPPGVTSNWRDPHTGVDWDATGTQWYDPYRQHWVRHSSVAPQQATPAMPGVAPSPRRRLVPVAVLALAAAMIATGVALLVSGGPSGSTATAAPAAMATPSTSDSQLPSGPQPQLWPVRYAPLPKPATESDVGGPSVAPPGANASDSDFISADLANGEINYDLSPAEVKAYLPKVVAAGWQQTETDPGSDQTTYNFERNNATESMYVTYYSSGTTQIEFHRPSPPKPGATGTVIPTSVPS